MDEIRMAYIAKPLPRHVSGASIYSWFAKMAHVIAVWRRRASEREALRRLNDCYLRDIGLTRQEVMMESAKPFWRV